MDGADTDMKIRVAAVQFSELRPEMGAINHHASRQDNVEISVHPVQQALRKNLLTVLAVAAEPVFKKNVQVNDFLRKSVGVLFVGMHVSIAPKCYEYPIYV